MLAGLAFLSVIVAGVVWLQAARRRQRIRRREQRNHELYLRTKRESTVAGWFRTGRTRRLTYQPAESDAADGPAD
ncbi:hypothetical protein BH10PSE15_BH10PSE15_19220 [soil metagenome]